MEEELVIWRQKKRCKKWRQKLWDIRIRKWMNSCSNVLAIVCGGRVGYFETNKNALNSDERFEISQFWIEWIQLNVVPSWSSYEKYFMKMVQNCFYDITRQILRIEGIHALPSRPSYMYVCVSRGVARWFICKEKRCYLIKSKYYVLITDS